MAFLRWCDTRSAWDQQAAPPSGDGDPICGGVHKQLLLAVLCQDSC